MKYFDIDGKPLFELKCDNCPFENIDCSQSPRNECYQED
jgi:hypothetical protein